MMVFHEALTASLSARELIKSSLAVYFHLS